MQLRINHEYKLRNGRTVKLIQRVGHTDFIRGQGKKHITEFIGLVDRKFEKFNSEGYWINADRPTDMDIIEPIAQAS